MDITFYMSKEGRISRKDYLTKYCIPFSIIGVAAALLDLALGAMNFEVGLGLFSGTLAVIATVPSIMITAKRLHDHDKSGWLQLLNFVPLANLYLTYLLLLKAGDDGVNSYGAAPL